MPIDELNAVLAVFGVALAGGGLLWPLRLPVHVRTKAGGAMSVAVEPDGRPEDDPLAVRLASDDERAER